VAQSAPQEDDDEGPLGPVGDVFTAFAGKDMDGSEFNKLCKDCELIDAKKFRQVDVDSVFAKVLSKGKRRINLAQFKDAVRLIAAKRGCKVREVQDKITSSEGPHVHATKTVPTRFHDDKNSYTGVHAHGVPVP